MNKLFLLLSLSACAVISVSYADRYIEPIPYPDQEEILLEGASIIISKKNNNVLMYQTDEMIVGRRCCFYFKILNNLNKNINFHAYDLTVTDQYGNSVRVVPKCELIKSRERSTFWKGIALAACSGIASANAQNAGNINYQSNTYANSRANFNAYGPKGYVNGSANGNSNSYTSGSIYVPALAQQAQDKVNRDTARNAYNITASHNDSINRINSYYLDSTTVFSGNSYESNFQIEIPSNVDKSIEYLLFTYDMDGEEHTFCFYCGIEKKSWHQVF
ncbi:hypothetical protein N9Y92_00805 [Chlamydiales bacterium]|nr:hypothetical protein [Chlamydiales bacterium]